MSKTEFYQELLVQVDAIITNESDMIANMANVSALIFDALDQVNWVGFYRVIDNELVLGPFQGKVACIRIPHGVGVCGTAFALAKSQCVANVHQFSGHIACDVSSNSEIVIPVILNNEVIAVLDVDSILLDRFDEQDQTGLEAIVNIFTTQLIKNS